MKVLRFLGDSLVQLRKFNDDVKQDIGYQLEKVQRGERPDDYKPMAAIGKGIEELRVWDQSGTYRVIYIAKLPDAVYVLHVFKKKTQATTKRDIELARNRFDALMRDKYNEQN